MEGKDDHELEGCGELFQSLIFASLRRWLGFLVFIFWKRTGNMFNLNANVRKIQLKGNDQTSGLGRMSIAVRFAGIMNPRNTAVIR